MENEALMIHWKVALGLRFLYSVGATTVGKQGVSEAIFLTVRNNWTAHMLLLLSTSVTGGQRGTSGNRKTLSASWDMQHWGVSWYCWEKLWSLSPVWNPQVSLMRRHFYFPQSLLFPDGYCDSRHMKCWDELCAVWQVESLMVGQDAGKAIMKEPRRPL